MDKKEPIDTRETQNVVEIGWTERFLRNCFLNQRKILQFGAGGLVLGILAILYGSRAEEPKTNTDAKTAFEEWRKTPGDELLTKEMERALNRTPALRRGLEAEIAQIFLSVGQLQSADPLASFCIDRLSKDSPLHADFAKTSLVIEQKEYQKALEMAVTLKENLELSDMESSLYGWNLMRIAFLHKLLQNDSGELTAWEEVKSFMNREQGYGGKFLEMGIGRPDFSLADFIAHRERELSSARME